MLMEAPELVSYILVTIAERAFEQCQRLATMGYECMFIVDSWASADIMSPKSYADCIAPAHRTYAEAMKEAGMKAIFWNTGNIYL